ncbi:LysR family transcriptional regulator [Clostridium sp.]|uniref:LysR family transcriptional regulator n=1 Tax=Clostridium sp. TaxID=1506 RepID=UPI002846B198|nr:LysR family transcriptional regulator [Clostridium sp.]MDR3595742.1 LysR family transcriptional regulator [Clostridium sp.]
MDIESLKTFITLTTLNNFTKTAEKHNVVQSTVTNRIKELEAELGKELFIRDKKNISLTTAGHHLLSYAKRIVELAETASSELTTLDTYSSILRIGSVHTLYDCHLHKYISKYLKTYKDVSVKINIDHSKNLLELLHDNVIDVCFSYIPVNYSQFECIPFKIDELALVTSNNNTTFKQGIKNDDLKNLYWLYCDFAISENLSWFNNLFPENHTFPLEIDIGNKIISFLKDGLGYSFLPRSLILDELENNTLIHIHLLESLSPTMKSYIIINKKNLKSKHINDLLNLIDS